VEKETRAYARTKIDAVADPPGLPNVIGEVHLVRAAAARIGGRQVVAMTGERRARRPVDRLQGRLRRHTAKATQVRDDKHRTTAPAWRGGTPDDSRTT
jgi:hypothetical protein